MVKVSDYLYWIFGTVLLAAINLAVWYFMDGKTSFNLEEHLIEAGLFIVYLKLCLAANRKNP